MRKQDERELEGAKFSVENHRAILFKEMRDRKLYSPRCEFEDCVACPDYEKAVKYQNDLRKKYGV